MKRNPETFKNLYFAELGQVNLNQSDFGILFPKLFWPAVRKNFYDRKNRKSIKRKNRKITNQLQKILNCRQSIEAWLISYSSEIGRQY